MADSSRIFVRGLPPNINQDDFRKHFEKLSAITDAKFIPHRRIGYVGYQSHEAASKAVKYFNKSFIRMSKIGVELARPVEDLEPEPPQHRIEQNGDSKEKRRQGHNPKSSEDPKLQQFLEAMAPPSKSKIWSNEGAAGVRSIAEPGNVLEVPELKDQSDEEYATIPRKRRRIESPIVKSEDIPPMVVEDDIVPDPVVPTTVDPPQELPSTYVGSDTDWLRSRTSRVLGLMDDEDLETSPEAKQDLSSVEQKGRISNSNQESKTSIVSDVASQTDDKEADVTEKGHDVPKPATEVNDLKSGRLFLRNLSYDVTTEDLRECFSAYGDIEEIHIPTDSRLGSSKGFAYVEFKAPDSAEHALTTLDGKSFHGRLLHILPAAAKREATLDEYTISKLPLKKQREIKRKAEAGSATFKWNSLYMNPDAVLSSISSRLGVAKSELLDPTSADAAVKQAHAETNIIQETKAYFSKNGVNVDSFNNREFSDNVILVKNFPYGTSPDELRKMFEAYGSVTKLLMPPSGTIAIVELELAGQARTAFAALAYRKYKDSILFLEKAPKAVFSEGTKHFSSPEEPSQNGKLSTTDLLEQPASTDVSDTSTLFVRNLNFTTTTEQLRELFQPLTGFMSARVKTKVDPKKPGQLLSMGFGFVEFRSKHDAHAALSSLNGYKLHGHDLLIKTSHKAIDAGAETRKEDLAKKLAARRTKVIIKNLPFEASKKDIRALFAPYGQLRSVRVPKKFDSSTRGFAFADFVTAREAENAMNALQGTHLLGRRLNMDFAAEDALDPEEEIEKMQKKAGRQADKVALQKLTSTGRKKFTIAQDEDADID